MFARTAQMLVAAQRASSFSTRRMHSLQRLSTQYTPLSRRHMSSHKVNAPQKHSTPPVHLWAQIRESRPAVRYTVYAGLALMATAESTFWLSVIRAKYFPSAHEEEKEEADRFLQELRLVIEGYRAVWLNNYQRYYGAYIWGLGYGGLDRMDHKS